MAVGWMTALKLVPWGEVLEATPQILQAARRLLGATQAPAPAPATASPAAPESAASQLAALQQQVLALESEQRASAVLIQSLAEQNAQLVNAVDGLRVRSQRLAIGLGVLGVFTAGLLAWAVSR